MKNWRLQNILSARINRSCYTLALLFMCALISSCGGSDEEKAQRFVEKGLVQLEQNNRETAKIEFKNALRLAPDLPEALYQMAIILEAERNWPKLEQHLTKLLKKSPDHVKGRLMLTNYYIGTGNIDAAKTHIKYLLKIAGDDLDVRVTNVGVLYRDGDTEAAKKENDLILKDFPKSVDALFFKAMDQIQNEDYSSALETLNKGIADAPDSLPLNLTKIKVLEHLSDWPAMVKVYEHLMELYPENAAPATSLSQGYASRNELDKAIAVLENFAIKNSSIEFFTQTVALVQKTQGADAAESKLAEYINTYPELEQLRIVQADLHLKTDRTNKATSDLEALLATTKSDEIKLACLGRLAKLDLLNGNNELAQQRTAKILKIDSHNETGNALSAHMLIKEGKPLEAIKLIRSALRSTPESAELLYTLGKAHESQEQWELAEENYGKAVKLAPQNTLQTLHFVEFLLKRDRKSYAERVLVPIIQAGTSNRKAITYFANLRIDSGHWAEAEKAVDALERLDGESIQTLTLKSQILLGKQDIEAAVKILEKLNSLDRQNSSFLERLTKAYVMLGRKAEAHKLLDERIKSDPNFVTPYMLKADLAKFDKNWGEAQKFYQKALHVQPDNESAHEQHILLFIGQKQYKEAQEAVLSAFGAFPAPPPSIRLLQARLYQLENKLDDSIKAYEDLLKSNPDLDLAANNLAILLQEKGGEENLQKAVQVANRFRQSQEPAFADTLGWLYIQTGNHEEGLALLRRAADKLPNIGEVQYHLGVALATTGKNELAEKALVKSIELAQPYSTKSAWLADAKSALDALDK